MTVNNDTLNGTNYTISNKRGREDTTERVSKLARRESVDAMDVQPATSEHTTTHIDYPEPTSSNVQFLTTMRTLAQLFANSQDSQVQASIQQFVGIIPLVRFIYQNRSIIYGQIFHLLILDSTIHS